jgi:PAS domain-containing protein
MLDSTGIAYIACEHSETAVSNGEKSRTRSVDDSQSNRATVCSQRDEQDHSADAALRSSPAALQTFFDGAPFQMGITEMTADQDMILVSVNAAAAALMGLTPEQAQGKRISDLGLPGPNKGVWLHQYL